MSTTHRARAASARSRTESSDYQVWAQCRVISLSIVVLLAIIALIILI